MIWTYELPAAWFVAQSVLVSLAIYALYPRLLAHFGADTARLRYAMRWLAAACFCYFIAWYLPSFLIDGTNTAFSTHFVGGGIFCALLWRYSLQVLGLRLSWLLDGAGLYFLVSGLGVANELLELLLRLTIMQDFSAADTWWDLLANTSGALLGWIFLRLFKNLPKTSPPGSKTTHSWSL